MPLFEYKAATPSGEVLQGRMEAANQEAVVKRLQAQGTIPIRAEEVTGAGNGARPATWRWRRNRVSSNELSLLTVELSTLLQAGLALDKALELLATMAAGTALQPVLGGLHSKVRGGTDLSEALAGEPRTFSPFYINMVRAGEASGRIDLALARLSEFLERSRALRATLVEALIYPAILLVFACVSLTVILGVVIPRIAEMFADAQQALPLITRIVITFGGVAHDYWWVLVLAIVGGYLYVRRSAQNPAVRRAFDAWVLGLPMVGELVSKYEAARFTRTLGTLLHNDVPLLDAIAIGRAVVSNRVISAAMERVATRVREGQGLARPLMEADLFPKLAAHLVQVGEQTGRLDDMLLRLADIYDRDVSTALKRMVDVLGPALILVLGLVIAGIILAILAAVLSVNELAF